MRFLIAVQRGQYFGKLERPTGRILAHDLARGGDGFSCIATHHIRARQHAFRTKLLRIALQRLQCIVLGALRIIGIEGQLSEQRLGIRREAAGSNALLIAASTAGASDCSSIKPASSLRSALSDAFCDLL